MTGTIRGVSAVTIAYCIGRWRGIDLTFPSEHNFKWQFIRNIVMVVQGLVYSWSQFYLPLPIAVTLYSTNPLFIAIWDYWLYGVTINNKQKVWFCLAFLGVILTANCQFLKAVIFGTEEAESQERYLSMDPKMQLLVALIFAVVQFANGMGMVVTKKLVETNAVHITYYLAVLLLLINATIVPISKDNPDYIWPSVGGFLEGILFSGIPLTLGMLFILGSMTISHNYGLIMPFQFSSIVVGYFMSIVRYG